MYLRWARRTASFSASLAMTKIAPRAIITRIERRIRYSSFEVARVARENRAVEAARADDEEAAGQGPRDHPVVGGRVHHVEPEGEDHRRESGPPELLVEPESGDQQDVREDRHEDDRGDSAHREEDRRR